MKKERAPIYDKLMGHYNSNPISFHVPGHKEGKGFNSYGFNTFEEILKIDMTEITGFDDLHQPEDIILRAEQKAARLFGAEKTFFLVNGSTSGNIAMILATCSPGDKIIVQRNVHKSVIHGIMLAGAKPIYINSEYIQDIGVLGSISFDELKTTLEGNKDVKAVFLTNPNYYGIGIDLFSIVTLVHQYKMPLLVDEAHGAHFGFHQSLPKSALTAGADIVVQSTHKTLSALTMGSMLHINSQYVDANRIKLFLSMIQTSSPSYPIMASLDLAREQIETMGRKLWDRQIEAVHWFKEKASSLNNFRIIDKLDKRYILDPLKVIINSIYKDVTGYDIQNFLEKKGIFVELADLQNVLLIVTLGTEDNDLKTLLRYLGELDNHILNLREKNIIKETKHLSDNIYLPSSKETRVSLEKILYKRKISLPIEQSIGEIAAEMVIPYPPGVPVLQMGEEVTKEVIQYILLLKEKGARFQGVKDTHLNTLMVIENN